MSTVYIRFSVRDPQAWRDAREPRAPQRAPLLEWLLSRATVESRTGDWRREAFAVIAAPGTAPPSVATAAWQAACGVAPASAPATRGGPAVVPAAPFGARAAGAVPAPDGEARLASVAWVCVATPVHLVAGMSDVTLAASGVVSLEPGAAQALAADFNRVFAESGVTLCVAPGSRLLCGFDAVLDVVTRDPEEVIGADVYAAQPVGADAPRLRRLMSEMELWLFEHPVNRARTAHALLPITGLWLWGGGSASAPMPTVLGWTAGDDPLFGALGDTREFPDEPAAGVVVCAAQPGAAQWQDVEARWLQPGLVALRAGRIRRLQLSAGVQRFGVSRRDTRRFWRRAAPWWRAFETPDEGLDGGQ